MTNDELQAKLKEFPGGQEVFVLDTKDGEQRIQLVIQEVSRTPSGIPYILISYLSSK